MNRIMKIIPKDALESLEFHKLRALLEEACQGEQGRAKMQQLSPMQDASQIERCLDEVAQFKQGLDDKTMFSLSPYESVEEELRQLAVEGYVLAESGLQKINVLLLQVRDIFKFFSTIGRQEYFPRLYELVRPVVFQEVLLQEIARVIDAEGNIRPDASPELQRIRRLIGSKQRELDRVFKSAIESARKSGWLTDSVESFRNGRRVLSVPSEHKRKLRGIIHDESATGRTAFIEPEAVIDINNDIFDLEQEEKREIYRILKALSAQLRPYVKDMAKYADLLIAFDVIQAKAVFARRLKANRPQVKPGPHLGLKGAYHPLLYLKNKQLSLKTVPFDLTLFGQNRILLLSGPNAGGKSIAMKSVGLLQLMFQCGLLVPAHPDSEMGVFTHLFTDIGDQQSLEDDLSTYSSRLSNAKQFLQAANGSTLVLIDEFGAGTDPKIGGAIAEAVLEELHRKSVFGVITTHYSNLKIYAFKTKGIVNGSMQFDQEHLRPTYELQVGRPGSSYAFEIAHKTGLPERVMQYARKRVGKQEGAVDQLLVDLQREKQETEEVLLQLREKQRTLDNLTRTYEELHRDLEVRRKRLKLEAKEQALQEAARHNKELEKVVRELREEKNLEKAQAQAQALRESRKELDEQVSGLKESIYYQPLKEKTEFVVGASVKLRIGGAAGVIESIDKNKAIILVGDLRMTVPLRDIEPSREQLDVRTSRSISSDVERTASFEYRLDVRGMRFEEVLATTEAFVDNALMANVDSIQIVHGKGSGALKRAVYKKLQEYRSEFKLSHPPREGGGEGVTIVHL